MIMQLFFPFHELMLIPVRLIQNLDKNSCQNLTFVSDLLQYLIFAVSLTPQSSLTKILFTTLGKQIKTWLILPTGWINVLKLSDFVLFGKFKVLMALRNESFENR